MLLLQKECLLQTTDLRKSWPTIKFPVKSSFRLLSPGSLVHRGRRLSPMTPQAVTMDLYACNLRVCPTDNCKHLQSRLRWTDWWALSVTKDGYKHKTQILLNSYFCFKKKNTYLELLFLFLDVALAVFLHNKLPNRKNAWERWELWGQPKTKIRTESWEAAEF